MWDFDPGTPYQVVPRNVDMRKIVEDRHRNGPLVPDKTGGVIQVNQAASGERGTEAISVHILYGLQ